jgi:hypothetical protein
MSNRLSLHIDAGATFDAIEFRWLDADGETPVDLSEWTGAAQVRATPDGPLLLEFDVNKVDGLIALYADAEATSALSEGVYLWALEMTHSDGTVVRLADGKVHVSGEVVR